MHLIQDTGCARSATECRDSLNKLMKEKFSRTSEGWTVTFCGLLLPIQVPSNTEVFNLIKVRGFVEADTEVLTSNNAAELQAFLVLVN